jgi:hypothetical protein
MSDELDTLRREVAVAHGLPEGAAPFLVGSTVQEIEGSARELARFVATGGTQEPEPPEDPLAGLFDPRVRAERKRRLTEVFTRSPSQPRDDQGRYASTDSGGFDGGARTPASQGRSPEAEHGQFVGQLAALSRTFRGQNL